MIVHHREGGPTDAEAREIMALAAAMLHDGALNQLVPGYVGSKAEINTPRCIVGWIASAAYERYQHLYLVLESCHAEPVGTPWLARLIGLELAEDVYCLPRIEKSDAIGFLIALSTSEDPGGVALKFLDRIRSASVAQMDRASAF